MRLESKGEKIVVEKSVTLRLLIHGRTSCLFELEISPTLSGRADESSPLPISERHVPTSP
jgi:hypothetical protein